MQPSIIAVKSTLYGITAVGRVKGAVHRDVPFSAHICPITVGFHYLGNRGKLPADLSSVSGPVFVHCRHPSHAHFVLIMPCQQCGATGTAPACIFKLAETYSVHCQTVYVRSANLAAVTT